MGRVKPLEWLLAAAGAFILLGLLLSWSGDENAFASFRVLSVLLAMAGIASLFVPVVVAVSRLTDVPIVWETLLWLALVLLFPVFLIAVLLTPPTLDWDAGVWVTLAGLIVAGLTAWKCVRRES